MDLGGSLQDIVRMGGCQGEYVIQNIARQIFTGVDFLPSEDMRAFEGFKSR